jgi:single-strand DNA-binding protein
MSSVNKVILIGNLGADVELRETKGGKAVAEIRMATSMRVGDEEKTEWHRVVVWDKSAENAAKYLAKGSKVYVEGRLQTRQYEDSDGNTRYITEVVANQLTFLDSKPKDEQPASKSTAKRGATQKGRPFLPDDDLPF